MLLQMQSLALEVPELQIAESGNVTPGKMSLYNCPVLVFFFFFFSLSICKLLVPGTGHVSKLIVDFLRKTVLKFSHS